MKRFDLTDVQANAILDTRLRQLRKLEEMELRTEHDEIVEGEGQHRGVARVRSQAMENRTLGNR